MLGNNLYSQGDQLELNCTSEGGLQLQYSWVFLDELISNTSMLIIDDVNTTHGGDYTCSVTNMAGSENDTIIVYSELFVNLVMHSVDYSHVILMNYNYKFYQHIYNIFMYMDDCFGSCICLSLRNSLKPISLVNST